MSSYLKISQLFETHYDSLSGRARNILSDFKIDSADAFYNKVIDGGLRIQFGALRACGTKTQKELEKFLKELLKNDLTPRDPILRKLSQDYLINKKFELHCKKNPKVVNARLRKLKADTFEGFYTILLQDKKVLSFYNLPDEIEVIRANIENVVITYFPETTYRGLFSSLWFLLVENSHLNMKEGYVFKNNLLFLNGGKWEDYSMTGRRFNQSAENYRALSIRLIRDFSKIVKEVNSNVKPDLNHYLEGEFVVIDHRMARRINEAEKTAFAPSFFNFVLMQLCEQVGYKFIKTTWRKSTFEGVFVRDDIGFDFQEFFNDMRKTAIYEKRREKALHLKDIFKKYADFKYQDPENEKRTRLVLLVIKSTPVERVRFSFDGDYLYLELVGVL